MAAEAAAAAAEEEAAAGMRSGSPLRATQVSCVIKDTELTSRLHAERVALARDAGFVRD